MEETQLVIEEPIGLLKVVPRTKIPPQKIIDLTKDDEEEVVIVKVPIVYDTNPNIRKTSQVNQGAKEIPLDTDIGETMQNPTKEVPHELKERVVLECIKAKEIEE